MNDRISFKIFRLIYLILSVYLLTATAQRSAQVRGFAETWVATDGLGRTLPAYNEVGPPRTNKYIGIFYFTWHDTCHDSTNPDDCFDIYDITKLISENPIRPAYGPRLRFHWWGEPEAGYYRAKDPWVIRRNLQMLSNAGVDFLYIDVTNTFTYLEVVNKICSISEKMRHEGIPTPYICFLSFTKSGEVINTLYSEFYAQSKYKDLWFFWDGKPLIFGIEDDSTLSEEARNFFTFRYSWAWTDTKSKPNHWQWLDKYPQNYGWSKDSQMPEQIPVAVASHPTINIGKSYHNGCQPPINEYKLTEYTGKGLHFEEQWERALQVDPEVIMITGWNEWIAYKFKAPLDGNSDFLGAPATQAPDSSFFVDVYNAEYNRDIEPMKGGYSDNHYYQMAAYIRKFKGLLSLENIQKVDDINIDGLFLDWNNIKPIFKDPKGDVLHRDWERYDREEIYVNRTGRNDIVQSRVAYTTNDIYIYVETDNSMTQHMDENWMLLFIDSDMNKETGWNGYEYLINKEVKSDSITTLAVWSGSIWQPTYELRYRYADNKMEIKVSRYMINQHNKEISFYFHWADNIQKLDDISEFFINGDSAPDRRFNYWAFSIN